MPKSLGDEDELVAIATLDAPIQDPTHATAGEFAVHTLPLSDPEISSQRLRSHASRPFHVITNPESEAALHQILAEASLNADLLVAVTVTTMPRLGMRLLTAIAHGEAAAGGVARAVAFADSADDVMMSEVFVPSINKLDSPAPRLSQAARSYLTRSQFVVVEGARSGVFDPSERPQVAGFTPMATAATDNLPTGLSGLSPELTSSASELPPWDSVRQYGNTSWIEVVSCHMSAIQMWSSHVRSQNLAICHWCGQPLVRTQCAFCGYRPTDRSDAPEPIETPLTALGGMQ